MGLVVDDLAAVDPAVGEFDRPDAADLIVGPKALDRGPIAQKASPMTVAHALAHAAGVTHAEAPVDGVVLLAQVPLDVRQASGRIGQRLSGGITQGQGLGEILQHRLDGAFARDRGGPLGKIRAEGCLAEPRAILRGFAARLIEDSIARFQRGSQQHPEKTDASLVRSDRVIALQDLRVLRGELLLQFLGHGLGCFSALPGRFGFRPGRPGLPLVALGLGLGALFVAFGPDPAHFGAMREIPLKIRVVIQGHG